MKSIIGIGEYAVSNYSVDTIKTFALGSCVAVTAYSPVKHRGAMIHVALPRPATSEDGFARPYYYATTGIPLMLDRLYRDYSCKREELQIQIFGGAESIGKKDVFHIGRRNIEAVYETLNSLSLKIKKADVGGKVSRTIELDTNTGFVKISTLPIII